MSLYADTSCFMKLLWEEPETRRVEEIISTEDAVIISDLAYLEVTVQVRARQAAGLLTRSGARQLLERAETLVKARPLELRNTSTSLIENARRQALGVKADAHCRTLDRLHLAAMVGLDLDRLLTNDAAQARAARALGIRVLMPRA